MWEKIVAFFMSIIAFFTSLFSFGGSDKEGYTFKNLAYGSHERQIMDLYLPEENDGEVGLVLFIHGGGWIEGNKDGYKDALKVACKDLGYAAAAINYRYISEKIDLHDVADDIDLALKKIKEKGSEKGININKVLLTGSSAGAHLAMFYAYSRKSTAPITPAAVVSNCGPTDLSDENFFYNKDLNVNNGLGDEEFVSLLFSYACGQSFKYEDRAAAKQALLKVSPIYYVNEDTVPTVINHGKKDNIVPFSNATAIVEKFEEYGVKYDFNIYPNSDHSLADDEANIDIADDLLIKYVKTYLGTEASAKW